MIKRICIAGYYLCFKRKLFCNKRNNIDYNNNIKNLIDDIKINNKKTYLITHLDEYKLLFFKDTFKNAGIEYFEINCIKELKRKINAD
jgi:hypothetical protein